MDAPGGMGNWGYDMASYGTKSDPTCVKASVEASVQVVEEKIQEIVGSVSCRAWLLVNGCWLSVVGCWVVVVGCWLTVVGCRLLVVG